MTTTTASFTKAQINRLRDAYAKFDTAPVSILPKFHALFAKLDDEQLKLVAQAGIKFVSKIAVNDCVRRGISI